MSDRRRRLYAEYAAALGAAVLFCAGWRAIVGGQADGWWLIRDAGAFGMLVVAYPVIEELSFRGVVQGALAAWTRRRTLLPGISWANLLTSVLFAAIHFVHHPPLWAVAVVVPSLIFGYFRDRTGGVLSSIGLHAFYNLIFYSLVGK